MLHGKLTCPLVFKGVHANVMTVSKLQNTHISRNQITFDDSYDQIITNLDSSIKVIEMPIVYNLRIDSHFINFHIFNSTHKFHFEGALSP